MADGKSGITRKSRYDHLITDSDSPIKCTVDLDNLYYEPFLSDNASDINWLGK